MRVLVATDLSKGADEALRQAAELARPDGALAAIHVLPSLQAISTLFPQRHAQDALDEARLLVRLTDTVRERAARICEREVELFVEQGSDYAEIVRRAELWMADIVVVGSHGASALTRVLGGVAERVVRHAHCRVLVARDVVKGGSVIAATDLSEPSLPAVVAAVDEARRRGVALKVVHAVDFLQTEAVYLTGVGTPSTYAPSNLRDPIRARLVDMLRDAGVSADNELLDGPPVAAIVRAAEATRAGLLVVGSHGRTGLRRLLLGSVAEKIVRAAPCSVMVVRMPV